MNFNANDSPLLVAPRPVRLSAQTFFRQPARLVSAPDSLQRSNSLDDLKRGIIDSSPSGEKENASPRASPRSALPSEALEEFLSILRPSFFPPRSPVLRARRQGATLPNYPQDRNAVAFRSSRGRIELLQTSNDLVEDVESVRSTTSSRSTTHTPDAIDAADFDPVDHDDLAPFRWFSYNLSSPVSRNNTRNPFQRHPSYTYPIPQSPSMNAQLTPAPLSPAAVPLPLPTPDEIVEVV